MVKARSIGTGLGSFFNNPGVIILGALAVVFLFFQGDIRKAFGSLGESISGGLGDINIQLPEIKLPDITFPSFDISNIFPSQEQFPEAVLTPEGEVATLPLSQPGEGLPNPADQPTNPTPIDIALSEGATASDIADIIGIQPDDPNQDPTKFLPPTEELVSTVPFAVVTPAEPEPTSALNLGQEQPLTEAPLGALSLSSIIDKFMVTASQASNIKFISQQGGDPFADPSSIFGENPPAVSDPQFQGLSPEEIALQLTGGNISNF